MPDSLTKLEQWHEIQRQGMGDYVKANKDMQEFLRIMNEHFTVAKNKGFGVYKR